MPSDARNNADGTIPATGIGSSSCDTSSITFETYVALTHKTLQKSRRSLDTRALIEMAYGLDALSVYGGSDMLVGILDDVLDKIVSNTVPEDFLEGYCRQFQGHGKNDAYPRETILANMTPKQRLDHIDRTIQHVREWEERREKVELMDVTSAKSSLEKTLLPISAACANGDMANSNKITATRSNTSSIQMEDVVRYREHQHRLAARMKLQEELQRVQDETNELQFHQETKRVRIQARLDKIEKVESELEVSANGLVPW